MKKALIVFMIMVFCVIFPASAEDIRVSCGAVTMNVPSMDLDCLSSSVRSPLPDGASDADKENAPIPNTALHFKDYERGGSFEPEVIQYSVSDLGLVSFDLFDMAATLSDMMNNVFGGYVDLKTVSADIPVLPFRSAPRQYTGVVHPVSFAGGAGAAAVISYEDRISENNLYYTMQGISLNGALYLSAMIPLSCADLNGKSVSELTDDSFGSCSPALSELDFYMQSIVLN